MNYKLLLGLFAVTSIIFVLNPAFAQEDTSLKYDAFVSKSTVLTDDKLIFFSPAKDSPPSISVQDTKTGSLLYKLYTPHKSLDDGWFGENIAIVGNNIATSSLLHDYQTNETTTFVYVFDVQTGNLLYTIENPLSDNMYFGYTLKSLGDKLAVYSSDVDPNDDIHDNMVYVFDGTDGSMLYTIENPLEIGHFGKGISTINNNFLIHNRHYSNDNYSGTIHAFEANTGKLQYTIEYPQDDVRDVEPDFGNESIISGNHVIVKSGDAVYVYDGMTGELRHVVNHHVTTASQLDAILDSLEEPVSDYSITIVISIIVIAVVIGIVISRKIKNSK